MRRVSKKKARQLKMDKVIVHALFERSRGLCEECGNIGDWRGLVNHEKVFKSHGGTVSLENSILVCAKCHSRFHGIFEP